MFQVFYLREALSQSKRLTLRKLVLLLLILSGFGTSYYFYPEIVDYVPSSISNVGPTDELTILHLDIGQGDSTLILGPKENGSRVSVLMDAGDIPNGGDKDGGAIVAEVLAEYGMSTLDYFVASHYDADHIGGLISGRPTVHGSAFIFGANSVEGDADDIAITHFIDRGQDDEPDTRTYEKYEAIADTMGTRISLDTQLEVDDFSIDLGDGATMTLYAANGFVRDRASPIRFVNTENERSLCFLISYGDFDYLIGGDTIGRKAGSENAKVELAIAEALVEDGINIDVYHVNHHGANNGSSTAFLERIQPEVAIISLGDGNTYGHPHAETLQRLADAGVQRIYQTEEGETEGSIAEDVKALQGIVGGNIILTTDGNKFEVDATEYSVDDH